MASSSWLVYYCFFGMRALCGDELHHRHSFRYEMLL